ncbi:unnamed protein product [Calypogeia fissa]
MVDFKDDKDMLMQLSLPSNLFEGKKAVFVDHKVSASFHDFCVNKWVELGGELHPNVTLETTHIFAIDFDSVTKDYVDCNSCATRFLMTTMLLHWDWIVASMKADDCVPESVFCIHLESNSNVVNNWHVHMENVRQKKRKREEASNAREEQKKLDLVLEQIYNDDKVNKYVASLQKMFGSK